MISERLRADPPALGRSRLDVDAGRYVAWWLGAITLLALILRVAGVDARSVWEDETQSLYWAAVPLRDVPDVILHNELHPPLFYILLNLWLPFSSSDAVLRLPSAIFGTLVVPVTYALGRRLADVRVGFVAALLAAVAPFLVWHAQEARPYALLTLLVSLAALCVLEFRQTGWWAVVAYGIVAAAALYTHYGAAFLIGGLGVVALLQAVRLPSAERGAGIRRVLAANGLALALFAPWALALRPVSSGYTSGYLTDVPDARSVGRTLVSLLEPYVIAWPGVVRVAVVALMALLLVAGVWQCRVRARVFLVTLLTVTVALDYVASLRYPVFMQSKILLPLLPPLLVVVAAALVGTWRARRRVASLAGTALVVATFGWQLGALFLPQPADPDGAPLGPWSEDFRSVAGYVETHAGANDTVLFLNPDLELAYRRSMSPSRLTLHGLPVDFPPVTADHTVAPRPLVPDDPRLRAQVGPGDFWLVTKNKTAAAGGVPLALDYYASHAQPLEQRAFTGLMLYHYGHLAD